MMPLSLLDQDWLNQNANRAYPLDEAAGGADISGAFRLPKSFLVDLLWPVHAALNHDCTRFHLSSVLVAGDAVIGNISYSPSDGAASAVVGSFVVDRATHVRNNIYNIVGTGAFADSVGRVAVGDLAELYQEGGGLTFDLDGARIVPTCIRPNLRGVSGLAFRNGNDLSDLLTGDVELVAGRAVRLTVEGNTIRIDATSDESLREDCACDVVGPCIQTINGIPPDDDNNFTLLGDECVTIEPITNGLQFLDKCSKACCGCDELKVVVDAAGGFGSQLNRLELGLDRLEAQLTNAIDNILASKTNANGCQ
jgi:hypothetical protein